MLVKKLSKSLLNKHNFPLFLSLLFGIISIPVLVTNIYNPGYLVSYAMYIRDDIGQSFSEANLGATDVGTSVGTEDESSEQVIVNSNPEPNDNLSLRDLFNERKNATPTEAQNIPSKAPTAEPTGELNDAGAPSPTGTIAVITPNPSDFYVNEEVNGVTYTYMKGGSLAGGAGDKAWGDCIKNRPHQSDEDVRACTEVAKSAYNAMASAKPLTPEQQKFDDAINKIKNQWSDYHKTGVQTWNKEWYYYVTPASDQILYDAAKIYAGNYVTGNTESGKVSNALNVAQKLDNTRKNLSDILNNLSINDWYDLNTSKTTTNDGVNMQNSRSSLDPRIVLYINGYSTETRIDPSNLPKFYDLDEKKFLKLLDLVQNAISNVLNKDQIAALNDNKEVTIFADSPELVGDITFTKKDGKVEVTIDGKKLEGNFTLPTPTAATPPPAAVTATDNGQANTTKVIHDKNDDVYPTKSAPTATPTNTPAPPTGYRIPKGGTFNFNDCLKIDTFYNCAVLSEQNNPNFEPMKITPDLVDKYIDKTDPNKPQFKLDECRKEQVSDIESTSFDKCLNILAEWNLKIHGTLPSPVPGEQNGNDITPDNTITIENSDGDIVQVKKTMEISNENIKIIRDYFSTITYYQGESGEPMTDFDSRLYKKEIDIKYHDLLDTGKYNLILESIHKEMLKKAKIRILNTSKVSGSVNSSLTSNATPTNTPTPNAQNGDYFTVTTSSGDTARVKKPEGITENEIKIIQDYYRMLDFYKSGNAEEFSTAYNDKLFSTNIYDSYFQLYDLHKHDQLLNMINENVVNKAKERLWIATATPTPSTAAQNSDFLSFLTCYFLNIIPINPNHDVQTCLRPRATAPSSSPTPPASTATNTATATPTNTPHSPADSETNAPDSIDDAFEACIAVFGTWSATGENTYFCDNIRPAFGWKDIGLLGGARMANPFNKDNEPRKVNPISGVNGNCFDGLDMTLRSRMYFNTSTGYWCQDEQKNTNVAATPTVTQTTTVTATLTPTPTKTPLATQVINAITRTATTVGTAVGALINLTPTPTPTVTATHFPSPTPRNLETAVIQVPAKPDESKNPDLHPLDSVIAENKLAVPLNDPGLHFSDKDTTGKQLFMINNTGKEDAPQLTTLFRQTDGTYKKDPEIKEIWRLQNWTWKNPNDKSEGPKATTYIEANNDYTQGKPVNWGVNAIDLDTKGVTEITLPGVKNSNLNNSIKGEILYASPNAITIRYRRNGVQIINSVEEDTKNSALDEAFILDISGIIVTQDILDAVKNVGGADLVNRKYLVELNLGDVIGRPNGTQPATVAIRAAGGFRDTRVYQDFWNDAPKPANDGLIPIQSNASGTGSSTSPVAGNDGEYYYRTTKYVGNQPTESKLDPSKWSVQPATKPEPDKVEKKSVKSSTNTNPDSRFVDLSKIVKNVTIYSDSDSVTAGKVCSITTNKCETDVTQVDINVIQANSVIQAPTVAEGKPRNFGDGFESSVAYISEDGHTIVLTYTDDINQIMEASYVLWIYNINVDPKIIALQKEAINRDQNARVKLFPGQKIGTTTTANQKIGVVYLDNGVFKNPMNYFSNNN